jgi:4-hydroxy-tetrahydrodipicolinate reductase
MSNTRFAINGAKGRMGLAVARVLEEAGHTISARFDKDDMFDLTRSDVVIDFSTPEASLQLARACATEGERRGTPIVQVVGATGFTPEQEAVLMPFAEKVVLLKSGNYSLGVNLMIGLLKQAGARLSAEDWDIEITEAHHKRKVDAPSGTALMLGEAAAEGRGVELKDVKVAARDGITGARKSGDIGFSVIRGGGIVGEHSVLFASEDELITFTHSARDRTLFARGATKAGLWGRKQKPGIYDMQDVLGF